MSVTNIQRVKRYRFDFNVQCAAQPIYDRSGGAIVGFKHVGVVNAHSDTHAIREAKKIATAPMISQVVNKENRNAR